MPLVDYVKDRRNKIVIGGTAGVGLIVAAIAAVTAYVQPAYRVESTDNERLWEVSTRGAIGVGTGANAFGASGDCLKSGGGSGNLMSYGTCGSGGGADSDARYVNVSGDTMTGGLNIHTTGVALGLSGNLVIDNNKAIRSKKTDGTLTDLLKLGGTNNLSIQGIGQTQLLCPDDSSRCFQIDTIDRIGIGREATFVLPINLSGATAINASGKAPTTNLGVALEVSGGTFSGTTVLATDALRSSGSLSVKGTSMLTGNTTVRGAFSGALLTIMGQGGTNYILGNLGIGQIAAETKLDVLGTISGTALTISSLNAASCDVKSSVTGVLSCGTDSAGSGFDQASTDLRYVNVSGDTMTGALNIVLTGGANESVALEIPHTASGRHLHAHDLLSLSGSLSIDGTAAASAYVGTMTIQDSNAEFLRMLQTDGQNAITFDTFSADGGTISLYSSAGNQNTRIGGDANDMFFNGGGDVGFGTNDPNVEGAGVEVIGTLSGTIIRAQDNLASSGALSVRGTSMLTGNTTVRGTLSGALLTLMGQANTNYILGNVGIGQTAAETKLDVLGTMSGSSLVITGLKGCDTIDTNAAGLLSCGTDGGGAGGGDLSMAFADTRYVAVAGDTMTGGLLIVSGGAGTQTIDAGLLMEIGGVGSGRVLHAQDVLRSSGSLLIEGATVLQSTLSVNGTVGGSGQTLISQGNSAPYWRPEKHYERHILFGPQVQAAAGSGVIFPTAFSGVLIGANLQASGYGSGVTVNVWFNNRRAFSTPLSTDNREVNSTTAASAVGLDATGRRFNKLQDMRIDVSTAGSGITSTGVVLTLFYDVTSW